ncbi:MAG: M24 family metallopeptidase [Alphaproteobacteria bacterium]
MTSLNQRVRFPISTAELERRWAAARTAMAARGVDALIVQGANNLLGGGSYLRWFTGTSLFSSQPQTVLFPRDGLMTAISHGPRGHIAELGGNHPEAPGIGRRVSSHSFPSVGYTGRYDAELLVREVAGNGWRRVALVGSNNMYYGPISQAVAALTNVELVDMTDEIDQITAIKSPEEIGYIRQAAAAQDKVFELVRAYVKPGMRDYEVMTYAQYHGQLMGCETGYYLGCSAPPGQPGGHRTLPQQGRQIQKGDIMLWQAETSGPGGFFVHIARIFVFGKTPPELARIYQILVDAQEFTRNLLKPGAVASEAFAAYNSYMRSRGLPEELRLHCHGQGYANVERPLIRHDETMRIAGNMNIGIHPSFASNEMFITLSDNFLIHASGEAERLHKSPNPIIEL